jgi:hypothetical protein
LQRSGGEEMSLTDRFIISLEIISILVFIIFFIQILWENLILKRRNKTLDTFMSTVLFFSNGTPVPNKARLKLGGNEIFKIEHIFWETQQVSFKEKPNVTNTVDFKDIDFILRLEEHK